MTDLAYRYTAVFTESAADARQTAVRELWAPDARIYTAAADYIGHARIAERVLLAHQQWVTDRGFVFRALSDAQTHHGGVRIRWEMVPAGGGSPVSVGTQFLVIDAHGLITLDYQFIDA